MNSLEVVYDYHERTKHHPGRYAASLGYMDWATQPNPFRRYNGAPVVMLPMPDDEQGITYDALFSSAASSPLSRESLSTLLRYALGLAAIKCMGTECWALRCNASSGNLHPTEGYVILPPIEGISPHSIVAHYAPKIHALEILASFDTDIWETLGENTLLVGIASIPWREAWKYGERAFRYTQLDAGHAQRSIAVAAALNGWHCTLADAVPIATLDTFLGLDQPERFVEHEEEVSDMLLMISPRQLPLSPKLVKQLHTDIGDTFAGRAETLSPSHHPWEAITMIERSTHVDPAMLHRCESPRLQRQIDTPATSVLLSRRSAREMDFARRTISRSQFMQLMQSTHDAFGDVENACSFVLFVHAVQDIEPGVYLYLLNPAYLDPLRSAMHPSFAFTEADENLYLLEAGDFRMQAKHICCTQDIAADGAFSLGMLCDFTGQLECYGASRYKSLYWECGAIGQQLYLEATALGLGATGIGCFLDDIMHRMLGLSDSRFQSLYHFTVGRAIPDLRLQTLKPYSSR